MEGAYEPTQESDYTTKLSPRSLNCRRTGRAQSRHVQEHGREWYAVDLDGSDICSVSDYNQRHNKSRWSHVEE